MVILTRDDDRNRGNHLAHKQAHWFVSPELACRKAGNDAHYATAGTAVCRDIAQPSGKDGTKLADMPLSDVIAYLEQLQNVYQKREIMRLGKLCREVAEEWGQVNPQLFRMQRVLQELAAYLQSYVNKEKHVLFPLVLALDKAHRQGESAPGTVLGLIRGLRFEQVWLQAAMLALREAADDYQLCAGQSSLAELYTGVQEVEQALHEAIKGENAALFPRAVQLEYSLSGSAPD